MASLLTIPGSRPRAGLEIPERPVRCGVDQALISPLDILDILHLLHLLHLDSAPPHSVSAEAAL